VKDLICRTDAIFFFAAFAIWGIIAAVVSVIH